eukprot:gb/GEZN01005324.1/.p1 GENE.gb/GEZN01005324.1/~~gb/GEZN01005324.1/.p1  ORF type:complete len:493 (+),score=48.77 gb/GEZN01005324.1/:28-1506(+)
MMDVTLFSNSVALFLGTFACGMLPLACPISKRKLDLVTTFGVGMLIGVAFAVIIPEGIHILYNDRASCMLHAHLSTAVSTSEPILRESFGLNDEESKSLALASEAQQPTRLGRRPHQVMETEQRTTQQDRIAFLRVKTGRTHRGDQEEGAIGSGPEIDVGKRTRGMQNVPTKLKGDVQIQGVTTSVEPHQHDHGEHGNDHEHLNDIPQASQISSDQHVTEHGREHVDGDEHAHDGAHGGMEEYIGHALVGGFLFMFLVEKMWGAGHTHGGMDHGDCQDVELAHRGHSNLGKDLEDAAEEEDSSKETELFLSSRTPPTVIDTPTRESIKDKSVFKSTEKVSAANAATMGILVHAAVDGMALGAIQRGGNEALSLIVFVAIILHKAPAAFGLSSFLVQQGLTVRQVQKHLAIFAASSPLACVITYLSLGKGGFSDGTLGLCLLVSGGTFVYTIAAHILPEANKPSPHGAMGYTALVVAGAIFPLVLMHFHSHAH